MLKPGQDVREVKRTVYDNNDPVPEDTRIVAHFSTVTRQNRYFYKFIFIRSESRIACS